MEAIEKYVPKKYRDAVAEIDREPGEGWWVYLKPGYVSTGTGTSTIHEYTLAELKKQFKTIILDEED